MKFPKVALGLAATAMLALTACNNNDTGDVHEEGMGTRPINYNQTNDNPAVDRSQNRQAVDERMNDRNDRNEETSQYDVARETADKITSEVDEIDRVYVLTTDNNAYVAASWDKRADETDRNTSELTDETKQKITDVVKSEHSDIDHVYISTNPDFFELSGQYMDDMENGQPVEGFFKRIGNMIERVFPDDNPRS